MREAERVELTVGASGSKAALTLTRALLSALWLVVIPLLLSANALRYLVPHAIAAPGLDGAFARVGRSHTLLLFLALFLVFAALIRYWRAFLPGGRYLSTLPLELVDRAPPSFVRECERASALLRWFDGKLGVRFAAALVGERREELARARGQLRSALDAGDWDRVEPARVELAKLTAGAEQHGDVRSNLAFAASLVVAALLAIALRATLFQNYEVNGSSMLPGLAAGDLLMGSVVNVSAAPRSVSRGDVIVLRTNVDGKEQELIKRVIGLPGDRISMQGVHPVINGWSVPVCDAGGYYSPDDQTAHERLDPGGRVAVEFLDDATYLTFQAAPGEALHDYTVKPGEVFVLGDNRNNSRDSRAFDGAPRGFPFAEVKAKVGRVLLSRTRSGEIDPASVAQRLGLSLHLDAIDTSEIEAGIRACLAARPAQTSPPKPSASQALAREGS